MSATEIRHTLNILNEMAQKPTRQELQTRQMKQDIRTANILWCVLCKHIWVEGEGQVVFAASENDADLLQAVLQIEEGLHESFIPEKFVADIDRAEKTLFLPSDLDSNGDFHKQETSGDEQVETKWFPLPANRVMNWCKQNNIEIPTPAEVQEIFIAADEAWLHSEENVNDDDDDDEDY